MNEVNTTPCPIDVQIKAGAFPCLLYHSQDDLFKLATVPKVMSLPSNVRKVHTARLGLNCHSLDDNVVYQMKVNDPKTSLLSDFCVVFTSYDETINGTDSNIMRSTWMDDETPSARATHLTKEIIGRAISWLRGRDHNLNQQEYESEADALRAYFKILNEVIPLQDPSVGELEGLRDTVSFIENHEWSDDCHEDVEAILTTLQQCIDSTNNSEYDKTNVVKLACLARRFLYKHVAKQTRIVAHIVDGLHRLTAVECVLIGYQQPKNDVRLYVEHAAFDLMVVAIVPNEQHLSLDAKFDAQMKAISAKCQESFGKGQPHRKKEFFASMLRVLDSRCCRELERPFFFPDNRNLDELDIRQTIEKFARVIIDVICDPPMNNNLRTMVPTMKIPGICAPGWNSLFKKSTKKTEWYSFKWMDVTMTLPHFITLFADDICNKGRYSNCIGKGFEADVFELVQVLLWSRISKEAYNNLVLCFHGNTESSEVTPRTASDDTGAKTNDWVSGIVDVIGTSVYFMFNVHMGQPNKEGLDQPKKEELLMRLIESAIAPTTVFFTTHGLDPHPPDWFPLVQQKMADEGLIERAISEILQPSHNKYVAFVNVVKKITDDFLVKYTPKLQKDYLSFIRVAFALHLQSSIVNQTKGKSTTKSSEQLRITEVNLSDPKMLFLCDTQSTWTASIQEYASDLAPSFFSAAMVDDMVVALTRKLIQSRKYKEKFKGCVSRHPCDALNENELYATTFSHLQELNNEVFVNDLQAIHESLPNTDTRRDDITSLLYYFNSLFEGIIFEEGMEQAAV